LSILRPTGAQKSAESFYRDAGDYAAASQCDKDHCGLAHARIDLRGTQFKVDQAHSSIIADGYDRETKNWNAEGITFLDGGQAVNMSSHCGGCGQASAKTLFLAPLKN